MIVETLEELENMASEFAKLSRENEEELMYLGIWTGLTVATNRIRKALSHS